MYQKCYDVLGVFHDDDWETVRLAYKKQIRRWHPDKFQDPEQKSIAELRSKELNQAFQMLDEYYRENGALPHDNSSEAGINLDDGNASSGAQMDTPYSTMQSGQFSISNTDDTFQSNSRTGKKRTIVLFIVAVGMYFIFEPEITSLMGPSKKETLPGEAQQSLIPENEFGHTNELLQPETSRYAGEDSNYKITPHGDSSLISIGSTKNEVLTIQGQPTRQTDASWEYGLSRIDFQNGRVVGWFESPMNPLRLEH